MNEIVSVEGLARRFGRAHVLRDVSFALPEGSVTVLLGENGEGKSTLLKLLLGLLRADRGTLRVLGHDPSLQGREARAVRRLVGYVPDAYDNPGWMTPRELFRFLRPQYPAWDQERAERLSGEWEVPLDRRFSALSRGQAARATVVAALAQSPRLLLLDECFAGLDPLARRDLLGGFLTELGELGVTTLAVTHDLDVAARLADRVLVLADGRIARQGTVEEVLETSEESGRIARGLLRVLEETGAPIGSVAVGEEVRS